MPVLLLVALAGCTADGPGAGTDAEGLPGTDPGGPPGSQAVGNGSVQGASAAATDTLWLTQRSRLDTAGPANLTILASFSGTIPVALGWNTTFNGTGNLSAARLVLWLDLENSAIQSGVGGDPGCTAALTLHFILNDTALSQAGGCASLGTGLVEPGEHRLEFSTLLTAFPRGAIVQAGDGLTISVQFGLSLPQGMAYVLGGEGHDSHLRLVGLNEPTTSATRASPAAG